MNNSKRMLCGIASTMILLAACGHELFAETIHYRLQGLVTDTSHNTLNDVAIRCHELKLSTVTDPNGCFVLDFSLDKPLRPDAFGSLARLEFDKEGHMGKTIKITSMDYFKNPDQVRVLLEPNPMGGDSVGFSARMCLDNTVGVYLRELNEKGLDAKCQNIPVADFKAVIDAGVPPDKRTGKTAQAEFHIYVSPKVKKVRAAFYISRHGIGEITSPVLRKFAEEEQVALVGMFGDPVQRGVLPVSLLEPHIRKLGELSGHPELPEVPFMTFGHSNGTGFSGSFPSQCPDRVIAWISYHPGICSYLQFPGVEKVPCLVMLGGLDNWLKNYRQDVTVKNMRESRNALMCVLLEPEVGHGPVNKEATWELIVHYCKAAMKLRLMENGQLRPVRPESGWLGEAYNSEAKGLQKLQVASYEDYKGNRAMANWLPNREFAVIWQEYGLTKPDKNYKPR